MLFEFLLYVALPLAITLLVVSNKTRMAKIVSLSFLIFSSLVSGINNWLDCELNGLNSKEPLSCDFFAPFSFVIFTVATVHLFFFSKKYSFVIKRPKTENIFVVIYVLSALSMLGIILV